MVARDGCLGTLAEVLETPYSVVLRVLEDFGTYYPQHIVLSQIAKGLSGEASESEPVREWDDEVDNFPPGYKKSQGLSEGEAWNQWLQNGGRWTKE